MVRNQETKSWRISEATSISATRKTERNSDRVVDGDDYGKKGLRKKLTVMVNHLANTRDAPSLFES